MSRGKSTFPNGRVHVSHPWTTEPALVAATVLAVFVVNSELYAQCRFSKRVRLVEIRASDFDRRLMRSVISHLFGSDALSSKLVSTLDARRIVQKQMQKNRQFAHVQKGQVAVEKTSVFF